MPINGVKWRFLGLNEKRCKRTYYIYIYRKSTYCKKVFFTKKTDLRGFAPKPPAGTPSLHPDFTRRRAGGTEENRFHSSGCQYMPSHSVKGRVVFSAKISTLKPLTAFPGY